MSRRNKVNPDRYTIAGRLAPDDMARERRKQSEQLFGATRERQKKPVPPWLANDATNDSNGEDDGYDAGADADDESEDNTERLDAADAIPMEEGDSDEAAQQPQAKPRRGGMGKQQAGGGDTQKIERRTREARKQETDTGTTRGARSAKAKPRSRPKASGARGTPSGGKAPKSRGSAARGASPQRAGKPAARKTASRGTQKATPKKGSSGRSAKAGNKAKAAKKAKKAKKR